MAVFCVPGFQIVVYSAAGATLPPGEAIWVPPTPVLFKVDNLNHSLFLIHKLHILTNQGQQAAMDELAHAWVFPEPAAQGMGQPSSQPVKKRLRRVIILPHFPDLHIPGTQLQDPQPPLMGRQFHSYRLSSILREIPLKCNKGNNLIA